MSHIVLHFADNQQPRKIREDCFHKTLQNNVIAIIICIVRIFYLYAYIRVYAYAYETLKMGSTKREVIWKINSFRA